MKLKVYTFSSFILLFFSSLVSRAQNDTLTDIFPGSNYHIYMGQGQQGYISGNNIFGDKAKLQRFDESYGVSSSGKINGLALAIPIKNDVGGFIDVAIWEDVNGVPGNVLATQRVFLADIDTAKNAFKIIKGGWFSNLNAKFDMAVNIPANRTFWAGVFLPQNTNDFVAIFTSEAGSFPNANTHVGEIWKDDTFHFFSGEQDSWHLDAALAIFPTVTFNQMNTESVTSDELQVYPNPTQEFIELSGNSTIKRVAIYDITGQKIREISDEKFTENAVISVSDLSNGRYLLRIEDQDGNLRNAHFEKL